MTLHPPADGPPCAWVRPLLDAAADRRPVRGPLRLLGHLYALAHAARCTRCRRYLDSLTSLVERLGALRESETDDAALRRIADRFSL